MNNTFELSRLVNFIKRQALLNIPTLLIGAGAVFGCLLLITLLVAYFNPDDIQNLVALYLVVLFVSGFIFTSRIFSELNQPSTGYAFLTLPASPLEKLLGSWLVSSPVYVAVYVLITFIIYTLGCLIARSPEMIGPFYPEMAHAIGSFMVLQTIFFLGAITFRKNNMLKTLFALFVFGVILAAFTGISVFIAFEGTWQNEDFPLSSISLFEDASKVLPFLFEVALGPFLLIVSYFKLKEREV